MYQAEIDNKKIYLEKQLRNKCKESGDYIPILTSKIAFSYISNDDLSTIRSYGWNELDLEKISMMPDGADDITRLAAWIREAGDQNHGLIIEDDPYIGYHLDEDGNYPAIASEVF